MAIKIFFCYAHEDESLLTRLKIHLTYLQRERLIDIWHDRDISAGSTWEQEISEHLNTAQIILLLVSPDFMASDYCYSVEMKRAMERHERREATVIPIILRPCHWQIAGLDKLQALPKDAIPVVSPVWHSSDEVFLDIEAGISQIIRSWEFRDESDTNSNALGQDEKQFAFEKQKQPSSEKVPELAFPKEVLPVVDEESRLDKLSVSTDFDALYREGVNAQSRGDLERALFLWQQILSENENFREGMLASKVQELQKKLPSVRIKRLREKAKQEENVGLVQQEVSTLKALLELNPTDRAVRRRLVMLCLRQAEFERRKGAWKEEIDALEACVNLGWIRWRIEKRLQIAKQNQQGVWQYENAIKLVEDGRRDEAKTELFELWQKCPCYGDPAKLMKQIQLLIRVPLSGWRRTALIVSSICLLASGGVVITSFVLFLLGWPFGRILCS